MENWSVRIRELEAKGWTLARIGRVVGLSSGAISDLKQGYSKKPTGMAAVKLHALHVVETSQQKTYPSQHSS